MADNANWVVIMSTYALVILLYPHTKKSQAVKNGAAFITLGEKIVKSEVAAKSIKITFNNGCRT